MKISFLVLMLAGLVAFQSCTSVKRLEELSIKAESALQADDKETALLAYEEYIAVSEANDLEVDMEVYHRAAYLAFELGYPEKAIYLLAPFRRSERANADTYAILARSYKYIDNLSLELSSLESYINDFPEGPDVSEMRGRLFEAYVESKQMEEAVLLWNEMDPGQHTDEALMAGYLQVQRALSEDVVATEVAESLLEKNPEHQEALDWLAKRHFRQAESLYDRELIAYENNRTRRQYAQLLDAMEVVNTDLRIALSYFIRLWELAPSPEYARFLVNIYERFQNEEQAAYFRRYLR